MIARIGRSPLARGAAAVVCFAIAVVLVALATDVARAQRTLAAGDSRYRWAPADAGLWRADERIPGRLGARLLGVDDDRAFREAIRAVRLARLDDAIVSDPDLAIRRNEAHALLEAVLTGDQDAKRRSRAAGLLGVLGLTRFMYETEERDALLAATIASLRRAIALDGGNDEAKYNLELAYQRSRGLRLEEGSAGASPTPGGSGSKGAGAGDAGSGY